MSSEKILILPTLFLLTACSFGGTSGMPKEPSVIEFNPSAMKIESSAFAHEGDIPSKYTCDGENVSPPLSISDVPKEAVSLALISDDPDAPGGNWVHWTVWNIDPAMGEIKEGEAPEGVEGMTSFGTNGYGGPCPPSGSHRYFFKLYALDTRLDLNSEADVGELENAIEGHVMEQAELLGRYTRQR